MRVEDAAKRIGVSKRTIYRWMKSGLLETTTVTESFGRNSLNFYERAEISIDDLVEADDRRSNRSVGASSWRKARVS